MTNWRDLRPVYTAPNAELAGARFAEFADKPGGARQRPLPGHFLTDQAALKCLYPVTRSLDPTGRGHTRRAMGSSQC